MLDGANIFTLLKTAEKILQSNNIEEPKADAEVLLSAVLQVKRSKLPLIRYLQATEAEILLFRQYIERRVKREPVAYITGWRGFMDYEFKVNNSVLIPRPETELMVEEVLATAKEHKYKTVLDLCTGSGCIAVSLAKGRVFESVTASDISAAALDTAKENAVINEAEKIVFIQSDLFENFEYEKFDIIVSNPPYVTEEEYSKAAPELKYEPKTALTAGEDGLFFYDMIARHSRNFLNFEGYVFVELNSNIAGKIKDVFKGYGFRTAEIINDYCGLQRILKAKM